MKNSIFVFTASAITLFSVVTSEAQIKKDSTSKTSDIIKSEPSSVKNDGLPQDTTKKTIKPKVVGGAEMLPSEDIVDNTSKSKDHTTLVSAIKSAGLTDSLKSEGPFTVFAPTNDAFSKLPAGTLDTLKNPVNKEQLADVVEYHVVPGKLTSRDLALAVARANGNATLTTIEGENLNVSINAEKNLQITDGKGNIALVTMFDVEQSNGIVHVINNVLLPKE
jgi:uncharacterized surface protein with fasciclin (FAS1) repeats